MAHGIIFSILGIILLANTTQKKYYTFIISIYACKFFILPFLSTEGLGFGSSMLQKKEHSPLTQWKSPTSLWACSLKKIMLNFNHAL